MRTNGKPGGASRRWIFAAGGALIGPWVLVAALLTIRSGQGSGYRHGDETFLLAALGMGVALGWWTPIRLRWKVVGTAVYVPVTFTILLLAQQLFYCGLSIGCG